jgi:hypothetical protein
LNRRITVGRARQAETLPGCETARQDSSGAASLDHSSRDACGLPARIQTVSRGESALRCWSGRLTGCGVLVNTSFNVRASLSADDAYRCFMNTGITSPSVTSFERTAQPARSSSEVGTYRRLISSQATELVPRVT